MIEIKEKKNVKTFWKGESAWDTERITEKSIYFLGIRVYKKAENFKCEPIEPSISKNIGFQK